MSKRLHLSCPRCNTFVPAGAGHSCVEYGPSEPLTYPREWKARAEAAEAKVAALEARLSDMAADRDETRDRCAEVTGRLVALEAIRAERDRLAADNAKYAEDHAASDRAKIALKADLAKVRADLEAIVPGRLRYGVRIFDGSLVAVCSDREVGGRIAKSYGWNNGEVVEIGRMDAPPPKTAPPREPDDLPRQETVKGGTVTSYPGIALRLFECEACAFGFDASHGNEDRGWSCPVCELAVIRDAEPAEPSVSLERADIGRLTPREFADKVCAFMAILGPVSIRAAEAEVSK